MTRRDYLIASLGAAAKPLFAGEPWGVPVFDIHLHPRGESTELAHMEGSGVDRAVLLGGAIGLEDHSRKTAQADPTHFVRFARIDIMAQDAVRQLTAALKGGAIGIGEMKYAVDVDGPEMRRVYAVAAEFRVPVLFHLEEGNFNTGIRRLPALLKAFPKTTFIGHGQTWWAHVSSEPGNEKGYPTGPVKAGGLTDRLLADYENMYGDLSAGSGRNAVSRDKDFTTPFLTRHRLSPFFI